MARTLSHLAGTPGLHDARVERAVDNTISLTPAVPPRLHALVAELAGRGRPGV